MKKGVFFLLCVCMICIMGFGALEFFKVNAYSADHFLKGTKINGIDCSGLTVKEASGLLSKEWNTKVMAFTQGGKTVGTISGFEFEYDIEDQLKEQMRFGIVHPLIRGVAGNRSNIIIKMNIKKTTPSMLRQVGGFAFLSVPHTENTRNAYVDMSNREFNIVPEIYGNELDINRFLKITMEQIANGVFQVEFNPINYYKLPTVLADDPALKEEQVYCRKYLAQKITYKMPTKQVILTPGELYEMMKKKEDGTPYVVPEKVKAFVEGFAIQNNTVGRARAFTTATGNSISVKGGTYGYRINQKEETQQLLSDLESGKTVNREPIYAQTPYVKSDEIGSSYVEVNLSSQYLWLFKDGVQILSTPIVSGNVNMGSATSPGVYAINHLQRNTILRGKDYDGTQYASSVSYWVPFYGGIGFHDADWRSTFGGDIYKGAGSHGCINMPLAAAATLFNNVDRGLPVVVHY